MGKNKKSAKKKSIAPPPPPEPPEPEETPDELNSGFYQGETLKGQRHGFGTYYFNSGARYIGNYEEGLKHGSGTFIYPDGSSYGGQWWKNQKHGYGRYIYANYDTYDGQWRLDERHGYGLYSKASSGYVYKGYWDDGKLCGPTQIQMHDVKFSGTYQDNHPIGPATYVLPNNLSIRGKYVLRGKKQAVVWVAKGFGPAYP